MAESRTDQLQDTEITLSTGKLLGIFFGLVFICSVFFTMGYMLGHSTGSAERTQIVGSASSSGSAAGKPSATNKTASSAPATYVADTQPASQAVSASTSATSTTASTTSASSNPAATDTKNAFGAPFMVQVAAVSKQEDADILVAALRKKQYPVFVASIPGDTLFHIQVGPFSDPKDAETMRARLVSDG